MGPAKLKDLNERCDQLRALIVNSFGVMGTIGMITKSTGEVELTTNGLELLLSARYEDPILRFVVSALNDFHRHTGDGSKQFILLLSEIVRLLVNMCSRTKINVATKMIQTSEAIQNVHTKILPVVVNNVYSKIKNYLDTSHVLEQLIEGFMNGQFSRNVEFILKKLTHEFLKEFCDAESKYTLCLGTIVHNFDLLCSVAEGRSVHDSVIGKGFLIQFDGKTRLELSYLNEAGHVKFVILKRLRHLGDEPNNEKVVLNNEMDVEHAITWTQESLSAQILEYKKNKIQLVLTSVNLPPSFAFLLTKHEILLISGVNDDDLESLEHLIGKMSAAFFEPLAVENIAEAMDLTTFSTGDRTYLQIMPITQMHFNPAHLIVYAPTLETGKQYKKAMLNCIKMISVSSNPIQYYSLSPAVNVVSQSTLGSTLNSISHIATTIYKPRTICDTIVPNSSERSLNVVPVGGLWEFLCHRELQNYVGNFSVDEETRDFIDILSQALLAIPRLIHNNSLRNNCIIPFVSLSCTALANIDDNIFLCIDGRTGNLIDARNFPYVESIQSKLLLLKAVLATLVQLLRVDFIICGKTCN